MNYYGKIEETDTLIGNMGLGVDYYKGEQGIPGKDGKDGKDGSDQVYVGADEPTDERVKLWIDTDATPPSKTVSWDEIENKPNLADVATSGDYNDLSNKPTIPSTAGLASEAYVNEKVAAIVIPEVPTKVSELENDKGYLTEHQSLAEYAKKSEIPAPYTLPTASTSTLGGVKVDGNTITIADGVISSVGSAEPDAYIKDASVSGNTLTLTKKDNTNIVFTPSGGSSGGSGGYHFEADTTLTDEDKMHIIEIWNNKNIPMFIGNKTVIRKFAVGATKYFCVINLNNTENKVLVYTIQTDALNTSVLSDKFTLALSYDLVSNTDGGDILTSNNWQNYITVGGGDGGWNYTNDIWDSNLYNAKELIFVMGNSSSNMVNSAQCYYNFSKDSAGGETTLGGSFTNCRYFLKTESGDIYWEYTGSAMNVYDNSESYYFLYKT